jgi:hypothetical protein
VPNCPHGFPQDQCLICRALNVAPAEPSRGRGRKGTLAPAPATFDIGTTLASTSAPVPQRRADTSPAEPGRGRRGGFLWPALATVAVGVVLVWAFAGVVSLAFHIAEYVVLAGVAGWLGYRLGYARGRRHPR